ncbi:protocatechuate 3,4-dioxygenase subunit alpha [Limobrevibacterium gyesilva]|uniref:Protocatechuate 3,4-dioxygenase subunit alpha n=1 Tax=Limobrevibacterium gyesilva TaxID=2991712 RepID=A0AA41YIZ6_9PROT|nr:protocatechuate 3,4-dioxygenase subunit alpha [Limobrevibacterium gyesilva]MCW3474509.1 protocatechuate 3,4-dioxygenase subunit alpha [Limobrevibacterium gyesilva]
MPIATSFQTIGPYWALIEHPEMADLTRFGAAGENVVLSGRMTDGDGAPVADAAIELWQASPAASETFPGWGRCACDRDGRFRFTTLKPGPLPGPGNAQQAPHVALTIFARGILTRLVTRAYFDGEPLNDADPILGLVEDPARRATLIARPDGPGAWRIDIRLQGESETVFMEF